MVINMDETKLRTIAQLQEFLDATPEVSFSGAAGDGDAQRYEHISRVLKRFDHPQRSKRERGVVLAYLRRTSGLRPHPDHPPGGVLGGQPPGPCTPGQTLPRPGRPLCPQVHPNRCPVARGDGPRQ